MDVPMVEINIPGWGLVLLSVVLLIKTAFEEYRLRIRRRYENRTSKTKTRTV